MSTEDGTIDVSWADDRLQRRCASDTAGVRYWGANRWPLLKRRLATLLAAPTIADLQGVPGRPHPLRGDRFGSWAMSLWGPYRLVFRPAEPPLGEPGSGADWGSVTSIIIEEVVDYHG